VAIRARWLLLTLLVCAAGIAHAQTVEVYRAQHRSAEELVPVAATAMAGEGRAVVDRASNSVILSGPRAAVDRALGLLSSIDIRRRTVALRYESTRETELASQGIEVQWSVRSGGVRVGNVRARGDGARVDIRLRDRSRTSGSRTVGQLRIADGETGRISTGVAVPITTRTVERGPFGPVVRESTTTVNAETGIEARPRVLGDGRIELALFPFDAQLTPSGAIRGRSADTVIVVEPGETVAIGGLTQSTARSSTGLGGATRTEQTEDLLLLVTANLE
jgi:type II secretory pathway component GspD/PulD (secretin)